MPIISAFPMGSNTDETEQLIGTHNASADAHKALFDKKADPATVVSVSLPASGWETLAISDWETSIKQTVTVTGVLADATQQQVMVEPASASADAYIKAGVQIESCAANSITFSAVTKPTADITALASIQNLFPAEATEAIPNMVFGTYEGDGEDEQFISLGFTPRLVLISREDGVFSQGNAAFGGLATSESAGKMVAIVDGGFNALGFSGVANGNNPMYTYKYVAIK